MIILPKIWFFFKQNIGKYMVRTIRHISHILDDFDYVICGVNGVISSGTKIYSDAAEVLYKLYQSGKKIMLATNFGIRAETLFYELKKQNVPMYIFSSLITTGEIVHFYLKNHREIGNMYYSVCKTESEIMKKLGFTQTDSPVLADFLLAETMAEEINPNEQKFLLEQALNLQLPMLCVGNNTSIVLDEKVCPSIGCLAEQYALMGGKIIPFGKPDTRIAAYLCEQIENFSADRCLVIGDNMATDMRMGYNFKAKTMLIGNGVHKIGFDMQDKIEQLIEGFGFDVDYFTEKLQW